MKVRWLYISVAFFLFEMTLPLCLDLSTDFNIELNEAEKESEKESEKDKEEKQRRVSYHVPGISTLLDLDQDDLSLVDQFRISENEFFELNDPPPEWFVN